MTDNRKLGPEMPRVEWRTVPGYGGVYEVSSEGRVRRLAGSPKCRRTRVLNHSMTTSGYPFVALSANGEVSQHAVHRLVALAFYGPSDLWVNHRNGIKTDNRVENIEYVTPGENVRHAIATGLMSYRRGQKHHSAKLTDEIARAIRADHAAGVPRAELAAKYGVKKTTIQGVVTGRTWREEFPEARS